MSVESVMTLPGTRRERQVAWLQQALADQYRGFAYFLARAFQKADDENAMKLANGFPELFNLIVTD